MREIRCEQVREDILTADTSPSGGVYFTARSEAPEENIAVYVRKDTARAFAEHILSLTGEAKPVANPSRTQASQAEADTRTRALEAAARFMAFNPVAQRTSIVDIARYLTGE